MARYTCTRCNEICNTTNETHLCSDLKKRYERQAKAISLVVDILRENFNFVDRENGELFPPGYYVIVAEAIVKALSGRDLGIE